MCTSEFDEGRSCVSYSPFDCDIVISIGDRCQYPAR
jgi:hypothetical protein